MLPHLSILATATALLVDPPQPPTAEPVPTQATLEVRIVQVDLERIAEIEHAQGARLEATGSWGISMGISVGDGVRLKPPVFELGDEGELRIGGRVWALGAALDDARRGLVRPDSPFTVLSAPRVACALGERAVVSMGSTVEWMVREDEGCLRLADDRDGPSLEEGVEIELRLAAVDADAIELAPIDVRLVRVVGREPVADVPLAVGRPVLRESRLRRDVRLLTGRVAVIPLATADVESDDLILVVVGRAAEQD